MPKPQTKGKTMKAIGQNATDLAQSGVGVATEEIPYQEIISGYALRSMKGITREKVNLNASKLFSACAENLRSRLGIEKVENKVTGKFEGRLPDDIANRLHEEIGKYILSQVNRINATNSLSCRQFLFADAKQLRVTMRTQAVGEDLITLEQQKHGIELFIIKAKKDIAELVADLNRYTREKESALQSKLSAYEDIKQAIWEKIAEMKKATTPTEETK